MLQVPSTIWNDIAATQALRSPWGKAVFSMSQPELTKQHETQAELLEKAGHPPKVALAYLLVAPLLLENEAISHYIVATERSDLRAGLPEVTTVAEAVGIASSEFQLNPSEASELKTLLLDLYPSKTAAASN